MSIWTKKKGVSILLLIGGISGSLHDGPAFLWLEEVADVAESFRQGIERSGTDPSQVCFEL